MNALAAPPSGASDAGLLPWPLAYTVSSDDCRTPMPLGFEAPLADSARELARLGYDGVEIQVRDVDAPDAERLRTALGPTGLRIVALATGPVAAQDGLTLTDPDPHVRQEALDRLLGAARLAAALGVPMTLGQTRGFFRPGIEDLQRRWAEQAVQTLAQTATALGTRLLIEPQTRTNTSLWNTPAEALAFTDTLDTPTGLALDTHHLEAEGQDAVAAVTAHVEVAGCLQLASSARRGPLDAGDLRLPGLLRALDAGSFTGWLTMEHSQEGDSVRAACRSRAAMHEAAAQALV
ncbi:sugar phosphate isomerase/epimerase family protein [Streptomyces solaniscabiei]|uniref:sugar phosphate isomerase/epimerase family protein n=1 Tax=Streptomyces solaniscabiei TaxID=2683255 RepID=UPI001CE28544|nr:sugar phosphate isomerase/epimerase family protein [Streptomyces solaniscabiei]